MLDFPKHNGSSQGKAVSTSKYKDSFINVCDFFENY